MTRGGPPDPNAVLRRIHDGFVGLTVVQGAALLGMLVHLVPYALGYPLGAIGFLGVPLGYTYAARNVGSDDNLDAPHAHWAKTIRNNGICIALASAFLVALAWTGASAGA